MLLYFLVNGFTTVSLEVRRARRRDFFASCLNVQIANHVAVPISFILIVIAINGLC